MVYAHHSTFVQIYTMFNTKIEPRMWTRFWVTMIRQCPFITFNQCILLWWMLVMGKLCRRRRREYLGNLCILLSSLLCSKKILKKRSVMSAKLLEYNDKWKLFCTAWTRCDQHTELDSCPSHPLSKTLPVKSGDSYPQFVETLRFLLSLIQISFVFCVSTKKNQNLFSHSFSPYCGGTFRFWLFLRQHSCFSFFLTCSNASMN
jgi:hypothetical protein